MTRADRWAMVIVVLFGLFVVAVADALGQTPGTVVPWPNIPGPQFTDPRLVKSLEQYPGMEDRWHFVIGSPALTPEWLAQHHWQSSGGSFGGNMVVPDFWYDAATRRLFTRSLVLGEVDDPVDLGCGRAPGVYPNQPNLNAENGAGEIVCQIAGMGWVPGNGFVRYFASVQFEQGENFARGLGRLSAAYGTPYVDKYGGSQAAEEQTAFVKWGHHWNGAWPLSGPGVILGYGGGKPVYLDSEGGNILHDYQQVVQSGVQGTQATALCPSGWLVIGGGGGCDNGGLRESYPTGGGWQITCGSSGYNKVMAICVKK